jgi:hypothetical protein
MKASSLGMIAQITLASIVVEGIFLLWSSLYAIVVVSTPYWSFIFGLGVGAVVDVGANEISDAVEGKVDFAFQRDQNVGLAGTVGNLHECTIVATLGIKIPYSSLLGLVSTARSSFKATLG